MTRKANVIYIGIAAVLPVAGLLVRAGMFEAGARISRRALFKGIGLGIGALAGGQWWRQAAVRAMPLGARSLKASCILAPEMTEGPYYIPGEKVRSVIRDHRPGIPLRLELAVADASSCRPIHGAAVDVWHCDAGGIYSGFIQASEGLGGPPGPGGGAPTDKQAFLRGIQFTDRRGRAVFETIYPGWYRGRTVHIHVKVHLGGASGNVVHTGQLFFEDSLTSKVYALPPYNARAAERDTFNNTDAIFQQGGRQSILAVRHDGHGGFVGSIVLGVRKD